MPRLTEQLLIYGAGLAGRRVRQLLAAHGYVVEGFLDRDSTLCEADGLPVTAAEEWAKKNDASRTRVIIGLLNPNADTQAISSRLQTLGYGGVVNIVEFMRDYQKGETFGYWLADPRIYASHVKKIAGMRAGLADTASQELLDRILAFRTSGDSSVLPEPTTGQYCPDDLPRWPEKLRFIDCGGYTGDTVLALEKAGYCFEALATFEPNLTQYATLTANLKHIAGAAHFPCGVSDTSRLTGFDPTLGAAGHLLDTGGEPVICLSLDDALPGFKPNLIKMDIEGEEPAALRGAQELIRRFRPNLAISIYHHPEHLWSIYGQIRELAPEYRFHLRCHAPNSFETVLYAFAD